MADTFRIGDDEHPAVPDDFWPVEGHPITGDDFVNVDRITVTPKWEELRTLMGPRHPGYQIVTRTETAYDWDGDPYEEAVEWRDATAEEREQIDRQHDAAVREFEKTWSPAGAGGYVSWRYAGPPDVEATFRTATGATADGFLRLDGTWAWLEARTG